MDDDNVIEFPDQGVEPSMEPDLFPEQHLVPWDVGAILHGPVEQHDAPPIMDLAGAALDALVKLRDEDISWRAHSGGHRIRRFLELHEDELDDGQRAVLDELDDLTERWLQTIE